MRGGGPFRSTHALHNRYLPEGPEENGVKKASSEDYPIFEQFLDIDIYT